MTQPQQSQGMQEAGRKWNQIAKFWKGIDWPRNENKPAPNVSLDSIVRSLPLDEYCADIQDTTGVAVCKLEVAASEDLALQAFRIQAIVTYRPTPGATWCCEVVEHVVPQTRLMLSPAPNKLFRDLLCEAISWILPVMKIDVARAKLGYNFVTQKVEDLPAQALC